MLTIFSISFWRGVVWDIPSSAQSLSLALHQGITPGSGPGHCDSDPDPLRDRDEMWGIEHQPQASKGPPHFTITLAALKVAFF